MRRFFILFIVIGLLVALFVLRSMPKNNQSVTTGFNISNTPQNETKVVLPFQGNPIKSIFIPYWNIPASSAEAENYDTLIYFGVVPDENGKMISDLGFKNIESFIQNTSNRQTRVLTIRMLDTDNNLAILDDVSSQSSVIRQTIGLIEDYGFDGVVLDLEAGVMPLADVASSISLFVEDFSKKAHASNRTFSMTIYGDTFYRARPYDIKKLSQNIDGMYIMAYDFHKSRGEPGPNFPFSNNKEYGYDFQKMISDFTSVVPKEKLTIIFGMYGYDWTLGPQGKPLKSAKAIPLKEIDPKGSIVDPMSKEKHTLYTDSDGYQHELWYEDEESVEVKIEYLKTQGIGSVGYWVWGYF